MSFFFLRKKLILSQGTIQDEGGMERGELRMFGLVVLAAAWAPGLLTVVNLSLFCALHLSAICLFVILFDAPFLFLASMHCIALQ